MQILNADLSATMCNSDSLLILVGHLVTMQENQQQGLCNSHMAAPHDAQQLV